MPDSKPLTCRFLGLKVFIKVSDNMFPCSSSAIRGGFGGSIRTYAHPGAVGKFAKKI